MTLHPTTMKERAVLALAMVLLLIHHHIPAARKTSGSWFADAGATNLLSSRTVGLVLASGRNSVTLTVEQRSPLTDQRILST